MSKIIKTYIDNQGRSFVTVEGSDRELSLIKDPSLILVPSLTREVSDDGTVLETTYSPSMIVNAGRFYMYTNNRWVTDSDDNYGINFYQYNENCGTGTIPLIEWEHKGILIPKGKTIKALHFAGDSTSTQVTDIEFYIVLRKPNPITRWETGMDADVEDEDILLHRDFFMNPSVGNAFSGNTNDTHARTILFNQYVDELSYLSIYLRPVGTITATRYFRASYTWEIQ